uniref:Ovule protein n=1 Tax=Ascaris lumbricoides TaxID=6252 RepID=A0A0M3IC00_ASCLU
MKMTNVFQNALAIPRCTLPYPHPSPHSPSSFCKEYEESELHLPHPNWVYDY